MSYFKFNCDLYYYKNICKKFKKRLMLICKNYIRYYFYIYIIYSFWIFVFLYYIC